MTISFFRGTASTFAIAFAALTPSFLTDSSFAVSGPCPADINGDSQVNVADLLSVINAWGPCGGSCVADIAPPSGDNLVNVQDLLLVISNWGSCAACGPDQGCLLGQSLWCENFELNNYSRWTGGYSAPTSCEATGFSSERFHGGVRSHKSQILCATSSSHRGYGGLRFQGDIALPTYTNSTGGIDAPFGVVITMWSWIDAPYTFDSTRWVSLLTCTSDCSNSWNNVITLNIDDASMRLKPVHVSSVSYASGAPAFPRGQWNRIRVYLNFHSGSMHVWQNSAKVCSAAFTPAGSRMCQWHFGLYASGPNSSITMFEDDYSIVKLLQPMTNFSVEPTFPALFSSCGIVP